MTSFTAVQRVVDELLDRARRDHPSVEFVIVLSNANSLLLPKHADQLERTRAGISGFYRGHVYRDALVEATADGPGLDAGAWLSPLQVPGSPAAPAYHGDLRTGQITVGDPTIS